jgi:hypothetical protein
LSSEARSNPTPTWIGVLMKTNRTVFQSVFQKRGAIRLSKSNSC